jgi:tetratricopeptide (TPR) repeat protein
MSADPLGLRLGSSAQAACDAYIEGVDRLIRAWPGALACFDRALADDPDFALAQVGRARVLQLAGRMMEARAAMAAAAAAASRLDEREASHVACFGLLLAGQAEAALRAVQAHLDAWPRDAMVLSTTSGQTGLIGMSGRPGRERALAALLDGLAPHYGDDPWFAAHHAMAINEVGRQHEARGIIERSMARCPRNGWGAHALAHVHYEAGETHDAIAFLRAWLAQYPREGLLLGHLSWHLALCLLASGDADGAFRLHSEAVAAEEYHGPALVKVFDSASLLWRAELAGEPRDAARWRDTRAFARQAFPKAGTAFADWHVALADAVAGDGAALEERLREISDLDREGHYPAGAAVPAFMRGFDAFSRRDFAGAIRAIEPLFDQRERICGSRAQIDLVEFTLLKAYLEAGLLDEARRFLQARSHRRTAIPVAGLEAVQ